MEISLYDFIKDIKETRIYGKCRVEIVRKLFENGKSKNSISDDIIKKWIAKTNPRDCPGTNYFEDNEIAFYGFAKFFKDGVDENQFRILKKSFCNCSYKFDNRFVDFETEDEDVICYSLANIFLDTIHMTKINLSEVLPKDSENSITTPPQYKITTRINKENNPPKTPELLLLEHFIDNFKGFGVDIFIGIDTGKHDYTEITDEYKDWIPSVSNIRRMMEFIGSIDHYINNEATQIDSDCKNNIEKFMNTFQDFMSEISDLSTTPSFLENIYVNYTEYVPTDKTKLQKIRKEYCEKLMPLFNQIMEEYDNKSSKNKKEKTTAPQILHQSPK